jgi:hypothetical protein
VAPWVPMNAGDGGGRSRRETFRHGGSLIGHACRRRSRHPAPERRLLRRL